MGASFYLKRLHLGYSKRTVKDLADEASDRKDFKSPTKFFSRCLENFKKDKFDLEGNCCKIEYRVMGAGPKKVLKVRYSLFDYFIDMRYSLKG